MSKLKKSHSNEKNMSKHFISGYICKDDVRWLFKIKHFKLYLFEMTFTHVLVRVKSKGDLLV